MSIFNSHSEVADLVKVTTANTASLAVSISDVESWLSVMVLAATLVYTILKIRAHTCKRCRYESQEANNPKR